jgi:signal peptidase
MGALRWVLTTDRLLVATVRELVTTLLAVATVVAIILAVSGVWPPIVAVESGSMEPNMAVGDAVYVVDGQRFAPAAAQGDTGVVTAANGTSADYEKFGRPGDVIVIDSPSADRGLIIHRAMFWVEAGENWYDDANESAITADNCAELAHCPAPHAGFITRGDANHIHDQAKPDFLGPVRPSQVRGKAVARFPELGLIGLCSAPAERRPDACKRT